MLSQRSNFDNFSWAFDKCSASAERISSLSESTRKRFCRWLNLRGNDFFITDPSKTEKFSRNYLRRTGSELSARNLEQSMGARNRVVVRSASLCSQAGRYDNPMPIWFLALITGLKLPTPVPSLASMCSLLRKSSHSCLVDIISKLLQTFSHS